MCDVKTYMKHRFIYEFIYGAYMSRFSWAIKNGRRFLTPPVLCGLPTYRVRGRLLGQVRGGVRLRSARAKAFARADEAWTKLNLVITCPSEC